MEWLAQVPPGGPWNQLVIYGPLGIIALAFLWGVKAVFDRLIKDRDEWVEAYRTLETQFRSEYTQLVITSNMAITKSGEANEKALLLLAEYSGRLNRRRPTT